MHMVHKTKKVVQTMNITTIDKNYKIHNFTSEDCSEQSENDKRESAETLQHLQAITQV